MSEKQDITQDLEQLRGYSARNLEWLGRKLGAAALAVVPGLVRKYTARIPVTMVHETHRQNFDAILKSGALYSKDRLSVLGVAHTAGMTHEEDGHNPISGNIHHRADRFTSFIYMRPRFGDLSKAPMRGEGFYYKPDGLPADAWISFQDPNQVTMADRYDSDWHQVVKFFDPYDVFMGEDIRTALVLQTLLALNKAQYIHDIAQGLPGGLTNIFNDRMIASFDDVMDSCIAPKRNGYPLPLSAVTEQAYAARQKTAERPLDKAVLESPHFNKWFKRIFTKILYDIARNGQIAMPESLPMKDLYAVRGGEVVRAPAEEPSTPVKERPSVSSPLSAG